MRWRHVVEDAQAGSKVEPEAISPVLEADDGLGIPVADYIKWLETEDEPQDAIKPKFRKFW